jgi:hypothetical protein
VCYPFIQDILKQYF